MIKKPLLSILFLIFIFLVAYRSSDRFQHYILYLTNAIISAYSSISESVVSSIEMHFDQADTIARLQGRIKNYEQQALRSVQLQEKLEALSNTRLFEHNLSAKLTPVKALAYSQMGDFYKVRINFHHNDENKIYGLIQNQYAAGIVISQKNHAIALLNGHDKCGYSVFIGEEKAPGIIKGRKKGEEILVDFIPAWVDVDTGDEVVTSGLDNIFFAGLKVGRVTSVEQVQGYKTATVKPYANALDPKYYWLIESL